MNLALDLISDICWSITYTAAIVLGAKRRTWCIPKLAICQNFAWEFWVVLDRFCTGGTRSVAFVIQFVWLLLDMGILFLWLRYDRNKGQPLKNAMLLVVVMTAMYLLAYSGGYWEFAAFLINAIMSGLFILRASRDHSPWTSSVIASAKLVGTLAATILNGVIFRNGVILWLGGLCLIFDSYYLMTLRRKNLDNG